MSEKSKRIKVTSEYLKDQYQTIYEAGDTIVHRRCGQLTPYGSGSPRDEVFLKFIEENVRPGSRILDASCGRGRLLRMLIERDFSAEGTEIIDCLFAEDGDLSYLPATNVDYAGIADRYENEEFDVVISNDVLEHLVGAGEIFQAVRDLAALSCEYLLVSVGLKVAKTYCTALKLDIQNLHRVRKPASWWRDTIAPYGDLVEEFELPGHWTGFWRVK